MKDSKFGFSWFLFAIKICEITNIYECISYIKYLHIFVFIALLLKEKNVLYFILENDGTEDNP